MKYLVKQDCGPPLAYGGGHVCFGWLPSGVKGQGNETCTLSPESSRQGMYFSAFHPGLIYGKMFSVQDFPKEMA